MDLDDIKQQAEAGLASAKESAEAGFNKVKDAVTDEGTTDGILDSIANAANKVTGGKFEEHVDSARDFLDGKLGSE